MPETIFTKILSGEIPSHKVYEDDLVFAFLDVGPLSRGHTLVIPKEEVATLDRLSDESSAAIGRVLPRIARGVLEATGAVDFNVLQNNGRAAHQFVDHVHFHIIPKFPDGPGLGITWDAGGLDQEVGAKLAMSIAGAIRG
ncbi:MAG: HIT family protein [Planctomycetota bacterium]|jgi:histidine triad (HIT) family protein